MNASGDGERLSFFFSRPLKFSDILFAEKLFFAPLVFPQYPYSALHFGSFFASCRLTIRNK
jgi:hypothetical protein